MKKVQLLREREKKEGRKRLHTDIYICVVEEGWVGAGANDS